MSPEKGTVEPYKPNPEDVRMYNLVQKVVSGVVGIDDKLEVETTSPNPYREQTEKGLVVEFYYGNFMRIWTPWGAMNAWKEGRNYFDISKRGGWKPVAENSRVFTEELQGGGIVLRLLTPEKSTKMDFIGPTYSVVSIDGQEIDEPVLREFENKLPYEIVLSQWKTLSEMSIKQDGDNTPGNG